MDAPLREPILVMADILKSELELDDGQVMIYNQRSVAPTTKGLYVYLSIVSQKVIGNNNYTEPTTGAMQETQELAIATLIQIDAMSQNDEARTRKDEIIMALRSVFAQQQQDAEGMRISYIPSTWVDASDIEGTSLLNRYSTSVMVFSISRKIKVLNSYYDTFQNPELTYNQ